jgi:SOS response regulatory protein OraA/RecX
MFTSMSYWVPTAFHRMPSLKKRDIEKLDEDRALALLTACNDTINGLYKKLDKQNRQKHLLEQRIRAVRGQRSLLGRIPDELMLDI